jgi:CRISPR-associated endonuclease Csn1
MQEKILPPERNIYAGKDPWTDIPPIPNPIVQKAVTECRKIIKAIKSIYGVPTVIRIEMARDMKNSEKERKEIEKKQREYEKINISAKEILRKEFNIQNPTYNDILIYKLYQECGGVCPYTGKHIPEASLFGGSSEVDIEHIIPYSRCMDDSYMNKTLCYAEFNRSIKGNKTPWEI